MCEGVQRARYRRSLTEPEPLEPGAAHELADCTHQATSNLVVHLSGDEAELVRYMDETVVPLHQEMGMQVVGTFRVIGDEDAFVWIRRFEDAADRDHILDAVHRDPRCAGMIDVVAELVGRPESEARLEPMPGSGLR